ncbi:hypothetical protein ACS0TY_018925 [Phlomoides rotata]
MACCLIHNYIRREMDVDPLESSLDDYMATLASEGDTTGNADIVDTLDSTSEWTAWRDTRAINIMDPYGSPNGTQFEKLKPVRGRRSWTKFEEDVLINSLTDVVNDGWKAENGFRAGFQRELEKLMRKKLPGTDIVANPHINSKIHVWKKEYGALSDLLSKSGIGWNSTTLMIEIEDESVWESCKRADPHVKGVRYKSWPYYTQWIEIFGKDCATGDNAIDPIDIVDRLDRCVDEQEGDNGDKGIPQNIESDHELEDNSICKPLNSKLNVCSKGKKRKNVDPDVSILVDSLGEFMKYYKESMCDLNKPTEKGTGWKDENRKLNDIMKQISWLTIVDKLKI